MHRSTRRAIFYGFIFTVLLMVVTFLSTVFFPQYLFVAGTVMIVIAIIPNRLQNYFYKEFYQGRLHISKKQYYEAVKRLTNFSERLEKEKKLIKWEKFMINLATPSIKALTYNGLGAAHLMSGNIQEAEKNLQKAIESDALYATPHYNLALISFSKGLDGKGKTFYDDAIRLGAHVVPLDEAKKQARQVVQKSKKKA